jgi:hypothetical protein
MIKNTLAALRDALPSALFSGVRRVEFAGESLGAWYDHRDAASSDSEDLR